MAEGSTQPCPACGLNVMVGYKKCPKCHAPMPGQAPRTRRTSVAGGTTSQPMERIDEARGNGLIWAIAGVALVAAVVIWATQLRGGSKKKPVEAAAPVDNSTGAGSAAPTEVTPDDTTQTPLVNRVDPAYVADALEQELSVERLFATVEVTEDLLDVRSAFCTDPRFPEITARYIADLRAGGVTRIRCSETHGAQVFERGL